MDFKNVISTNTTKTILLATGLETSFSIVDIIPYDCDRLGGNIN